MLKGALWEKHGDYWMAKNARGILIAIMIPLEREMKDAGSQSKV